MQSQAGQALLNTYGRDTKEVDSFLLIKDGRCFERTDAALEIAKDLNHYHGFVDGCLTGKQPSDGFDYAGPLTEAVQLGNIAQRFPKKTLHWDYDSLQFTNHEAANQFVSREYRKGWDIKAVK